MDYLAFREEIDRKLYRYLSEFCENKKRKDVVKWEHGKWVAFLMFCKEQMQYDILPRLKYKNNLYNRYDKRAVLCLLESYIFLCFSHNKVIRFCDFQKLSGIQATTIREWGQNGTRYRNGKTRNKDDFGMEVYRTLRAEAEESLVGQLIDGNKGQVLGALSVLNRCYGWRDNKVSEKQLPIIPLPQGDNIDLEITLPTERNDCFKM